jgi:hypothetical protein
MISDHAEKTYPKRSRLGLLEIQNYFQKTSENGAIKIIDVSRLFLMTV